MFKAILTLAVIAGALLATPVLADPLPGGFFDHPFNGPTKPFTEDGVTTFQVFEGGCSDVDYGDGRGESDCSNGNVKSQIGYRTHAKLGETLDYSFELWVDPAFAYAGAFEYDSTPFRAGGWDSNLRIASWEGPDIKSFVYMLKLDSTNGATFFGKQCVAPADFGKWVKFSLKVRWANDSSGWVKVTCDDRIVYADEATSSTAQIQCYLANECQPGVVRDPKRLQYIVGMALNGFGDDWQETGREGLFSKLPPEGITIKMRNIAVTNSAELYAADDRAIVAKLQNALNGLGCDVGTADGVVGKKTRQQALTCRVFKFGEMPAKLTVATAPVFADLYTRDGVADLPRGDDTADAGPVVDVAETRAEQTGTATEAVSTFEGTVGGDRVAFLLIGQYDYAADNFTELNFLLQDDIKTFPAALAACNGYRTEDWGDSKHVVLELQKSGSNFANRDKSCLLRALPGDFAVQARLLLERFDVLAQGMVLSGSADRIQHEGVKRFISKVAKGDVTISK
jgi:hypothetical protein